MTFAILRRHFLLGSLSLLLGSLFMPVFAADLLDEIKSNGTLEVGLEGTYPPFNYQDESGELTGFEVDFANALAEELGSGPSSSRPSGTASSPPWNPSAWTW